MSGKRATGRSVRPYTITEGRAGHEIPHIALEALVNATPDGWSRRDEYRFEAAEIILLSVTPTAVIELAAMLEVPVGVIRVLTSDLSRAGAVTIAAPEHSGDAGEPAYADLLQQVLDGIKSL